jgi:hypothetical protein
MRHPLFTRDVTPMIAALHAGEFQQQHPQEAPTGARPRGSFITISRQDGAGGRSLAIELVGRLNEIDPGELPWTVWDNELVERVAAEYRLPPARVAALEDERPSWLEETLGNLSIGSAQAYPDELTVYHRVAMTIRALAEMGRVVIVGRGAVFVTRDLPRGVHVRLVAPVEFRVAATARTLGISPEAAGDWVKEKDRSREAFYRRHWPKRPLLPESFTMTLNTGVLSIPQQRDAVLAVLLTAPVGVPSPSGEAVSHA